jgi:arylsulfatase A-like enzyme
MAKDDRPNVLLIVLDDLKAWLGCLGTNPDVRTPHMDRLASQGTLFSSAVCPSPVCEPSRTALLTGMRPTTTGCYVLRENLAHSPARHRGKPFPLHFRESGYHTMMVGKVDHAGQPVGVSALQAFNTYMWCEPGTGCGGQQMKLFSRHRQCDTGVKGIYSWAWHWGPLDEDQAGTLADTQVARWAGQQLQRDFDKPFLLAAGFHRPHVPLIAPQRFFDLYDMDKISLPENGPADMEGMPHFARQVALTGYQDNGGGQHKSIVEAGKEREILQAYLACISYADHCVGQVLSALESSKYADNTIVVLLSDNGYGLGEHFHWKKWSLFESGSRVPLIVKAPNMPAGQVCKAGVDFCDIYPTLVDLCGLEKPDHLDGESLRDLLSGERADRDRPGITSFGPGNHSLRTSRYRYSRYADGSEELYDVQEDPMEWTNLAESPEHAQVRDSLSGYFPTEVADSVACVPPAGGPFRLNKHDQIWFRCVEKGFDHTRIRIRARLKASGDGPVVHHGGFFARYGLYVKAGRLGLGIASVREPLGWDRLDPWTANIEAEEPLPEGWVEVEGVIEADGAMRLGVDGETVATGQAPGALAVYPSGMLEVGRYTQNAYPNVGGYERCEDFPGRIEDVRVDFGR